MDFINISSTTRLDKYLINNLIENSIIININDCRGHAMIMVLI